MSSRRANRCLAVVLGLALDRVVGEPSVDPHPVAAFGSMMTALESRWYADDMARGTLHLAAGAAAGSLAGRALGVGPLGTAVGTYISVAGRALGDVATEVGSAVDAGDLDSARQQVRSLVGRSTDGLDRASLARAVVESVAENTVDAVVAPALWAAVGGASGALGYRAVNTLDAMVGHHSTRYERFGWASARADDVANWVPARATALLVAFARPTRAAHVARIVARDASGHPSPNSGVAEAAFAAALGCQLGGTTLYDDSPGLQRIEQRPILGDGPPAGTADIARAVALLRDVTAVLAGVLVVSAGAVRGGR